MDLKERVIAAYRTLHGETTSDRNRDDADKFLRKFQKTEEAWQVADQLLSLPHSKDTSDLIYFGASTMHQKLRYDFDQLPEARVAPLKDLLFRYAVAYQSSHFKAFQRLCMSLASLWMAWPGWRDGPREVATVYRKPDVMPTMLEVLKQFPEECSEPGPAPSSALRKLRSAELDGAAASVIEVLGNCYESAPGASQRASVMLCFRSWIRFVRTPPEVVARTPLLKALFNGLKDWELIDDCIETLVSLVCRYTSIKHDEELVKIVLPEVLNLEPFLQQLEKDEDEDLLGQFTRLFAETGESYVDIFFLEGDYGQVKAVLLLLCCSIHCCPLLFPSSYCSYYCLLLRFFVSICLRLQKRLLHLLLRCSTAYTTDIAKMCFHFWFTLYSRFS